MATFAFELVSPERLLFGGDVESVGVPGTEGEFTVLKDHAPLMSTLKPGVVTVTETGAKETRLFVRGGFADVAPTGLTLTTSSAPRVIDCSNPGAAEASRSAKNRATAVLAATGGASSEPDGMALAARAVPPRANPKSWR